MRRYMRSGPSIALALVSLGVSVWGCLSAAGSRRLASSPAPPPGVLYTTNSPLLLYILPRPLGSSPVALCQRLFLVVALLKSSSSIVTSRHPSPATHLFLAPPFAHDYSVSPQPSQHSAPVDSIVSASPRCHCHEKGICHYASTGTGIGTGTGTGTGTGIGIDIGTGTGTGTDIRQISPNKMRWRANCTKETEVAAAAVVATAAVAAAAATVSGFGSRSGSGRVR